MIDWIWFGPAKLIAAWPYAGAAIAAVLIGAQVWLDHRSARPFALDARFFRAAPVFVGFLWLIFGLYERQITAVFKQAGNDGTFRIDLVVLVPILYVLTAAAILSLVRQWREK